MVDGYDAQRHLLIQECLRHSGLIGELLYTVLPNLSEMAMFDCIRFLVSASFMRYGSRSLCY